MTDLKNIRDKPYIIGLSGGSASGKTSVSKEIFQRMGIESCLMITMDSYYRVLTEEERKDIKGFNFDHPTSFDYDLLLSQLRSLLNGNEIEMPIYSFVTSSREKETENVKPAHLIVFEGIFALYDQRIRDIMDMKVFVDTDDDIRLARRIYRDVKERGRNLTGIIERYNRFVKPAYDEYIKPQRRYADIIIPKGSENKVAIELVCNNLNSQLNKRKIMKETKLIKNFEFINSDIFDTRSFDTQILKTISDTNKQVYLKGIFEDIVNQLRPQYEK